MKKYFPHLFGALFVLAIIGAWALVATLVKPEDVPQQTMTEVQQPLVEEQQLVGGFSEERPLQDEERTFFMQVYQGEVFLTPKTVSTQVVAGTNYRFRCEDTTGVEYMVTIFVPLPCYQSEQQITVTNVEKIMSE